MEVDYRAVDEHQESSGGTLLHSLQPLPLPLSESPVLPPAGQQQVLQGCPTLSKLKPVLIDAPVCVVSLCVDAPHVLTCSQQRKDLSGWPACELCGRRLSTVKHHRQHGNGRACHPRCKPLKHAGDNASLTPSPAARSHKRTQPDQGKQQALTTAPPPPPLLPLRPTLSWHTHGWSLLTRMRMIATCCSCSSRPPPHHFPTLSSRDIRTA
jgi:hypothetical protein